MEARWRQGCVGEVGVGEVGVGEVGVGEVGVGEVVWKRWRLWRVEPRFSHRTACTADRMHPWGAPHTPSSRIPSALRRCLDLHLLTSGAR